MKTQMSRRPSGFTLVELLVVIAIIAVLAGAGFAAGNAAIQKAKRTTALATATALESAVANFYTEYGSMPTSASTDETLETGTSSGPGADLLKALLGQETIAAPINTRGIKFLSVKEGKAKRNGLMYGTGNPPAVEGLFDPWGGPYHITLDADYDEIVEAAPSAGGKIKLNGRRAVAWSNGADGTKGGGKTADDVKTW